MLTKIKMWNNTYIINYNMILAQYSPGFRFVPAQIVSMFHFRFKKKPPFQEAYFRIELFYYNAVRLLSFDSSKEWPIRYSSTLRAHSLPSLIAQTTSDCPRRISPQLKMRPILV